VQHEFDAAFGSLAQAPVIARSPPSAEDFGLLLGRPARMGKSVLGRKKRFAVVRAVSFMGRV